MSGNIDRQTIEYLEKLSRLELAPGEIETMAEQLDRIVAFVKKLQSVDTADVEATSAAPAARDDALRDDEVVPGLDREDVLSRAPDRKGAFFRVPRVIERGDE
jgi:aspartyl-tRNA(Asn)/glutamyl-tRNA(Gln) amidotransferase subunit C